MLQGSMIPIKSVPGLMARMACHGAGAPMDWTREIRIVRQSVRTALRAATTVLSAHANAATGSHGARGFKELVTLPTSDRSSHKALDEVTYFGSNPGRLKMLAYVPQPSPSRKVPLVVVLHGCGQGAAAFARASGWCELADELRFAILVPEQSGANNKGRCFRWFEPRHATRDHGEALSIRQMIAAAVETYGIDPARVFSVGLSAGGAMSAALMASYPDVFAAGAVVAGLPVGAAAGAGQALARMAQAGPDLTPSAWSDRARRAGPAGYDGTWPRLSVWHGGKDAIVDPGNADLIVAQWCASHGVASAPSIDRVDHGMRRRVWLRDGTAVVEQIEIPAMGHGYPIDHASGVSDRYVINAEISATRAIAGFWGLDAR